METKRRLALISLMLILMLVICACAPTAPPSAAPPDTMEGSDPPAPAAAPQPADETPAVPTVTDQAGRSVTIEGPVTQIVSGFYISSSACIALGLADKLVGIEARADTRPIYALAAPTLLDLPNVGTAREFNLEACIALEPDLVILPLRLRESADIMAEMGIPAILVNPESPGELAEMLHLIASAANAPDAWSALEELTADYHSFYAEIGPITAGIAEKPTVYMCGVGSYLTTAPGEMYQSAMVEAAGGRSATADIPGNSWTEISYEQLLAINPDVMIIPSEAGYGAEDILGDPQLAQLSAVVNGRVYQMPGAFEAWDSPVPAFTLGIRWLLSVLHEDIYPMDLVREEASRFYSKYYGIDIDVTLINK